MVWLEGYANAMVKDEACAQQLPDRARAEPYIVYPRRKHKTVCKVLALDLHFYYVDPFASLD